MPTLGKTKVSPSLISTGSSFLGTSSYAVTASFAMNGGGGGSGGNTQTGSIANQTILYNVTTSQDNVISGLNLTGNKWGVTVVEEWNNIPGDLNISSCSLLMHFSGSNNSTTFIDNSPNNFTVSANGNTKITSSISKFGGTSAYFDGTGDNLLINYNTALHLSGDFTIEVWFYPISLNDSFILNFAGGLNIAWASYELFVNANGVHFVGSSANNGYDIGSEGGATGRIGTPTLNTWNHIAVTRQGNVYRGFIDGVQGYTQTLALTPYNPNARGLAIGSNYANTWGGTPAYSINGYLDELRITKGVARYTASFATQSVQFPDSLPQYETKYIGSIGGLNDSNVDYGVEKLNDSSLKIRKMTASGQPLSGSGALSASVDRVYVNVLNYDNVSISGSISNAISSSYSLTASYNLNSVSSSFANTATSATSASYSLSSSFATNAVTATSATSATSANSASYSLSSSYSTNSTTATSSSFASTSSYNLNSVSSSYSNIANTATSASYSLSSSYSVNSNTSVSSSFASTASYNLNSVSSSFSTTSSYNLNSVSSSYSLTASFSLNGGGGGTTLTTGSTYPITSSWATNSITASYAMNGGGGGSVQTGNIANQTILYNVTTSQDNVISGLNLSSNKWGITVVEEWNSGSIVGDEYYNSCSLLLHFSGSNGSTTFIDNSPSPKTATSNNGASISTAQSKFGGASGLFDGTNDYVTVPDNSAFDFGAGDFTIEYWEYRTSNALYKPTISRNSAGQPPWMLGWSESGNINFFAGNGSSWSIASAVSMGVITTNVWTHYAVTRQGNTFRTFQNGIQISTFTSAATLPDGAGSLQIGSYAAAHYYPGYLDELRLTKGVARYTGSFVTQSAEFLNNANVAQYATKYIGLVGGLNDSNVDYGVEKLSDSSLKIRKMTASGQPLSGSGTLSASVDRVYVNVLDYTNVMVTSSYALTASYVLGGIQTGSISNQTILYNVTTSQDNTITGLDLSGNKWDVSVIEEWNSGSVPGDEYYNSCSLLLHFSGSNGSTTFTDNSPSQKTITANGTAQISTAQSKFGGSSAYFDGSGDYLTTTSNSSFAFGTGDYTIEAWVYPTTIRNGENLIYVTDVTEGTSFGFNQTQVFIGARATALDLTATYTVVTNVWTHLTATRQSGTVRIFANGNLILSGTVNRSCPQGPGGIGDYPTANGNGVTGYIDEVRVTKGVARYTGSFVTQSAAFPDNLNVTQLQTKYVGLVGGINDSTVDYGVEKLSDGSLKIRKMSASGQPLSGSGALSASVDRVYVNVLNYKEVQTTAQSASYAVSASYLINAASGESFHPFLLG